MPAAEISGTASVVRALEALADDLGDLRAANTQIAAQGAAEAARDVPKRTGRLARSVKGRAERGNRAVVTVGSAQVDYAGYVAYGTKDMQASEFPRRTDRALEPVAVRLIDRDIDTRIRADGLA